MSTIISQKAALNTFLPCVELVTRRAAAPPAGQPLSSWTHFAFYNAWITSVKWAFDGQVGNPYSATLQATAGASDVTFIHTAGTLPAGLALHEDGSFSGAPLESGLFQFSVAAQTPDAKFAERNFELTILEQPWLALASVQRQEQLLTLGIRGNPGLRYEIQTALNPEGPWHRWSAAMVMPPNGAFELQLARSPSAHEFFRAVSVPAECPGRPDGWVHEWNGDSEADRVGAASYTAIGTPSRRDSPLGTAWDFDGLDDRCRLKAERLELPENHGGWTLAFWVRRLDSLDKSSALLMDDEFAIKLEQFGSAQRNLGITWFGHWDESFNYSAPLEEWVHLALEDRQDGTELYVNGVPQEKLAVRIPLPLQWLGGASGDRLRGAVDGIQVFARELTSAEAANLRAFSLGLLHCP